MAIITAVNRPKGQTRAGLNCVLQYAMQDKKTVWESEKLVTGINCLPQFVYTEMMNTKLRYGKDGNKMYYEKLEATKELDGQLESRIDELNKEISEFDEKIKNVYVE